MARKRRTFLGILSVVFLSIVVAAAFGYHLLTKPLPTTTGELSLAILQQPVQVYRDEYGVPHILAQNRDDLHRAFGYIMAQDRLWQMDFYRRIASGRLSEIFGSSSIERDKFLRIWGFRRIAEQITDNLSGESRLALRNYADGVNAFIEANQDRLPLEFSILSYKPQLWEPEDTIAISRFIAWRLSFSWYVDLALSEIVEKLGASKASDIFPGFPKDGPHIISGKESPFWTRSSGFIDAGLELREFLGMASGQIGSNSWVISGAKSACGKPLLANDPHMEISAPAIWHEVHLSDGEMNVAGVVLPGTPVVMIGHNEDIAWGLTNGMIDDVDFYLEKVNPENPNQYWDGGAWRDFVRIEEPIAVKDSAAAMFEILSSRNGPVISDFHPVVKDGDKVVTMRWAGFYPSDELAAVLELQRARTWTDFVDGVRNFRVPAQNFVFASAKGDIGYYLGGAIPLRRNTDGMLLHEGWTDTGQWYDWVPFEKQPHVLNPVDGYIVTANNRIVDDRYPYYLTNLWEPPSRASRLHELLADGDSLTLQDFKTMQLDVVSVHARELMPILLNTVKAEIDSTRNERLRMLYDLIKTWNGQEDTESIATSIFNATFLKITENMLKDELGDELYENYIRLGNVPSRVVARLLREDSAWFDNQLTPEIESRDDIIVRSMLDAADFLGERYGDNISNWKWGELHALTMQHPLGRQKPLDSVFNLGPFPRPGSKMTVNNSEYRFDRPFTPRLGASTRQLVDFCNINESLSVITSGQSGHPLSEHYDDQTELWLSGEYHRLPLDWVEIMQTASQHLVLKPE